METTAKFNKKSGIFIIAYHIFLFLVWPWYFYYTPPSGGLIAISVVLFFLSGISITAGYHRLISHLTYKTNRFVEAVLLFFGTMATQGSALRWAYEHRLHHAYVDTDRDPYSIKKGFWYAHILWLFYKQRTIDKKVVADLYRNPLIMFQHTYYPYLMVFVNAITFLFVGWLLQDYWGAFIMAWWTRLFFLHHCTWFINSLAHFWGSRSYSQEHSAVDNYVISLLTFGEGYHNYHHTFAHDYRNGIRWYHFDPTKWLIWGLSRLGWAYDLKQVNQRRITSQLLIADKNELLDQVKGSFYNGKEVLEQKVNELAGRLEGKLAEISQLVEKSEYYRKMDNASKEMMEQVHSEIKQMKKSLNEEWKNWKQLSKAIRTQQFASI